MKTIFSILVTAYLFTISSLPLNAQTAVKVLDINPAGYAISSYLYHFDNKLIFCADDGVHGYEPWISDGTAAGTKMLKDINPNGDAGIYGFKFFKGKMYFNANDGIHGNELWLTDGTAQGTVLFKDIHVNAESSSPSNFHIAPLPFGDSVMLFTAEDAAHGRELWITGGTVGDTRLAADINPGYGNSNIHEMGNLLGNVYFSCDPTPPPPGTSDKPELWKFDGIFGTVSLLKDISPIGGSSPNSFIMYKHELYFNVRGGTSELDGIWKIGAMDAVTKVAGNISMYGGMTLVNDNLLFRAFTTPGDINNIEPWISDGTAAGTHMLKDIVPGNAGSGQGALISFNGKGIFNADDGIYGIEPWITDGTTAGTKLLKNISIAASSNARGYTELNGTLYFWVNNGTGNNDLYSTDGSELNTTSVVADVKDVSYVYTTYKGTIYFLADEGELHKIEFFPASLSDNKEEITLNVYPNPATDHVNIDFAMSDASAVSFILTDVEGKAIYSQAIAAGAGKHTQKMQIPNGLTGGMYFIHMNAGNASKIFKFNIQPK